MFRLNNNIKSRLLNKEFFGRNVSNMEYEVQNKVNELRLNNRNCSYQIKLNKFSWEVLICSKRNVLNEELYHLRNDYKDKYDLKNLESIESWGNFNYQFDEKKYKLILSRIKCNWREITKVEWKNEFFVGTELEKDIEIFKTIYNWKESINHY
tara:strand:- start:340 stop:798 length:459 start_codon:yes stop_codon:yes gene_type:complete